jgi:hypothetical protein
LTRPIGAFLECANPRPGADNYDDKRDIWGQPFERRLAIWALMRAAPEAALEKRAALDEKRQLEASRG